MGKLVELSPDDTQMFDQLEQSLTQFLLAYSDVTGIDYWSLILMVFDISHGTLSFADRDATVSILDATTKIKKAGKNLPAQTDRRRKAMIRILERGQFLAATPQGTA